MCNTVRTVKADVTRKLDSIKVQQANLISEHGLSELEEQAAKAFELLSSGADDITQLRALAAGVLYRNNALKLEQYQQTLDCRLYTHEDISQLPLSEVNKKVMVSPAGVSPEQQVFLLADAAG